MRPRQCLHVLTVLIGGAVSAAALGQGGQFTRDFNLERCGQFIPSGGNEYFHLDPGRFRRYEGVDEGEFVELEITVLDETREIRFRVAGRERVAIARIVEEREWADKELVEVSRNYFARCPDSGDIFYFGEEVDIYKNGKIIGHEGAWLAGEDGARPGLIMPNVFLLGSKYYQEIAREALDRAEHVEMGLTVETPAGKFNDCVVVLETTPLEPDSESIKVYAPGIGLIVDDFLELVEYR